MNRRSFLQILSSLGVAVVAAPKLVMESVLEAPVTPAPEFLPLTPTAVREGLRTFVITMEGYTYKLQGYVVQQRMHSDGEGCCDLRITPSGSCELIDEPRDGRMLRKSSEALPASGVSVSMDGRSIGEIQEITLPTLRRHPIDITTADGADAHYIPGLKRMSDFCITLNTNEVLM